MHLDELGATFEAAPKSWPRDRPDGASAESRRFRAMVDGIDAIVWEADPLGKVRFINRRAEEWLGYPASRWTDEPGFWGEIVHPDDREWAADHRRRCSLDGLDGDLEYRVITAEGRTLWLRESVKATRDGHGRVELVRGAMWDIGRRKKAERQLQAHRRELADRLDDMTYLHELGRRLWAEPEPGPLLGEVLAATAAIHGAEMGLIRSGSETVAALGLAPDVDLDRLGRLIAEGGPAVVEDVEADPDGPAESDREAGRIAGFRGFCRMPLVGRGGEPIATIATFFRRPHRPTEAQIRLVGLFARQAADFIANARRNRALLDADRGEKDALAALARDLRGPIEAIRAVARAIGRQDDGPPPGELLDLIARQAEGMARRVDDLIASRMASG